jgi:hypothetical protein
MQLRADIYPNIRFPFSALAASLVTTQWQSLKFEPHLRDKQEK